MARINDTRAELVGWSPIDLVFPRKAPKSMVEAAKAKIAQSGVEIVAPREMKAIKKVTGYKFGTPTSEIKKDVILSYFKVFNDVKDKAHGNDISVITVKELKAVLAALAHIEKYPVKNAANIAAAREVLLQIAQVWENNINSVVLESSQLLKSTNTKEVTDGTQRFNKFLKFMKTYGISKRFTELAPYQRGLLKATENSNELNAYSASLGDKKLGLGILAAGVGVVGLFLMTR